MGLLLSTGDGALTPPKAKENQPRVRIAAYDHALLRPVEDEQRRYVVLGYEGTTTQSEKPLRTSQLVAYDRATTWQLGHSEDGDQKCRPPAVSRPLNSLMHSV